MTPCKLVLQLLVASVVTADGLSLRSRGVGHSKSSCWPCGKDIVPPKMPLNQGAKEGGPQAPRDIDDQDGTNAETFPSAALSEAPFNLCNIHYHLNSEHRSSAFSTPAPQIAGKNHGVGFTCSAAPTTKQEPSIRGDDQGKGGLGEGAKFQVQVGDTIEVHWVFSTCKVFPGSTLGACLMRRGTTLIKDECENPILRVEAQVFTVEPGDEGSDFAQFAHITPFALNPSSAFRTQLPDTDGGGVEYRGSTTGPKYKSNGSPTSNSPFHVTWNVRKDCKKISFNSLKKWGRISERSSGQGFLVFGETGPHGARELVTLQTDLAPIGAEFEV